MKMSICLLLLFAVPVIRAWDNNEMEIFDLVEEINQNFYEYLDISNEATTSEVKKAYRRLSLVLHPDRNSAPDAELKFRWLASIYDILKDPEKRAIYDRVLVEGLPDWRRPIYYYRRMRKMGLAEGLAYTFIITTVIQYCINWAAYWEKKFTFKENVSAQLNRKKQKSKAKKAGNEDEDADKIVEEYLDALGPKPTFYDTLPFQLFRFAKYLAVTTPTLPSTMYTMYAERKEKMMEEERLAQEEEEERIRREEQKKERKERQKQKKLETKLYREKEANGDDQDDVPAASNKMDDVFNRPANALQIWTDDDLSKLSKLMKRFPGGSNDRWENIAEILERYPWEVTKMAKKVKDKSYMIPVSKSAQGVTGLESKKLVSDDRLEATTKNDTGGEDEDDDEEGSSDADSDNSDYVPYKVATKEDYVPVEVKEKKKTKGGKLGEISAPQDEEQEQQQQPQVPGQDGWNQVQQKALESALQQFPKGTAERWDRIASKVSGKTKEECMIRVRYLAEVVKKKRVESAS